MLDQRIAGQRADHEHAGLRRFETRGKLREGGPILAREIDAHRLDELARSLRTRARNDAVAGNGFGPVAGFQHQFARAHLRRAGFALHHDAAVRLGLFQQGHIGGLGAGEFRIAIEDGDDIALRRVGGQAQGILDPRIARTDDGDMFVVVFGGIVQLILDMRQFGTGNAQHIGIALRANGQHHRLCRDGFAALQLDGEGSGASGDLGHFGVQLHVDLVTGHLIVPDIQDRLTLAGVEIQVAAQDQIVGRRHDVLALLVFVDRVGEMVGLLQQHMAHAQICRACGRAQARRARTYNGYTNVFPQRLNPPRRDPPAPTGPDGP